MADLEYCQRMFFISQAAIDGCPTSWGIYKTAASAATIASGNAEKLNTLNVKVEELSSELRSMRSEYERLHSEHDRLLKAIFSIRWLLEKHFWPTCTDSQSLTRIIAEAVAPTESAKPRRPKIIIPLGDDPFRESPALR